jgi:hypothetical protein
MPDYPVDRLPDAAGGTAVTSLNETTLMPGIITHVDPERWVVNVEIQGTGQIQYDIPILNQYFYKEKGQGVYAIPETGAQCIVANALGQRFVLGYLPPVDPVEIDRSVTGRETEDLSEEYVEGKRFAQSEEDENIRSMSYRCNREEDMLPGDYCMKTRAGNKVKVFSNGNILAEATKLCTRIYSALKNWIFDICVNYLLRTPGGEIRWTNAVGSNQTDYRRLIKQKVTDKKHSFTELIGHDAKVYERTIRDKDDSTERFREHIQDDGEWDQRVETDKYHRNIDPDGNVLETMDGDHTQETEGKYDETIQKDHDQTIHGAKTVYVDDKIHIESVGDDIHVTSAATIRIFSTGPTYIN